MDHIMHEVSAHMGGGEKPKKEIDHIKSYKSSTKGDTIHEHHHKHPEHHPMEKHTTRGDDEMAAHMMANMGTPNPGEGQDATAEPATPPDAAAGAAAGAAPNAAAGAPPMAM